MNKGFLNAEFNMQSQKRFSATISLTIQYLLIHVVIDLFIAESIHLAEM